VIGLAESGGDGLALAKEIYAQALSHVEELFAPYSSVIDINRARLPSAATVDNWTGAILHIFLQGDFVGTAGPGGELYASIPKGASLFYARIDLNQFDWIPFGPENFDCDGTYSFTITP
jgi:hypothetical protein